MKKLLLLIPSRLVLFLFFQMLIALCFNSWGESVKYWTLSATITNIVGIFLLSIFIRQENNTFFSLFRFDKTKWKADLIWFFILLIVSVPIAIIPSLALSNLLWGNTEHYHQVLFQPINLYLVYFLTFLYPITSGLAELTTYFGYIMPRLKIHIKANWAVIVIPTIAFSIQFCTLPLVFEAKFILFRGIMYLLFAAVFGIALYKRPSLLPWLCILLIIIYLLPMFMLVKICQ